MYTDTMLQKFQTEAAAEENPSYEGWLEGHQKTGPPNLIFLQLSIN